MGATHVKRDDGLEVDPGPIGGLIAVLLALILLILV
jgi:hypothetical protein